MKSDLTIKNRYCTIPQAKFRKWDEMDVLLWKLGKNDSRRRSGVEFVQSYWAAWPGLSQEVCLKIISFRYMKQKE